MKRFTAASSAVAAATLVSAAALMGASGALASEPLRLGAAQMDAVTAGAVSVSAHSSASIRASESSSWATVIIMEDGEIVVERHVVVNGVEQRLHTKLDDLDHVNVDIAELRGHVEAWIADLRERQAELRSHAEVWVAELRQRAAAFQERAHMR